MIALKNKKAFILIEITIVICNMAIMVGLSWMTLSRQKNVTQVEDAANIIAAAINKTHTYALTGKTLSNNEVPEHFTISIENNAISITGDGEQVEAPYVFDTPIRVDNATFTFHVPDGELNSRVEEINIYSGTDANSGPSSTVSVDSSSGLSVVGNFRRVNTSSVACECDQTRAEDTCKNIEFDDTCGVRRCPGKKMTGGCCYCDNEVRETVCYGSSYSDSCGQDVCQGNNRADNCCTCNETSSIALSICSNSNERYDDSCGQNICPGKKTDGICTCHDGIKNGTETGVDCGGPCPVACVTCSDGIQNGSEEGVDCGGSCPNACFFEWGWDPDPSFIIEWASFFN